jgi:hypothetical protein
MRILLAFVLVALTLPALAQAQVQLPKPRPVETTETAAPPAAADDVESPVPAVEADDAGIELPRARPDPDAPPPAASTAEPEAAKPAEPAKAEDVPVEAPKPPRIYQSACPAMISGQVKARALPPIAEGQCGASSPLAVSGVMANGRMVPLSGTVTTTCGMATALPGWIASIDGYLFAKDNTRIESVLVGTSYMCRNVNNGSGGNLSFHGFADAVDIVGFRLEDGRTVTVEGGWSDALSSEGRMLRFAHDSACATFTTTLGPEANAQHRDHFHLDLGCHGKTCTARLCE